MAAVEHGAETAPAKVNLYLHVLDRRGDGYHRLDSLVVFAGAADIVRAERAQAWSLDIVGPNASGLADGNDNLVLHAAQALHAATGAGWPAHLVLEKHLPVASGIGGGSADAAATLRLLARLWGLRDEHRDVVAELAARLGADVPVCLQSRPALMGGIGDVLTVAPRLPPFGLALLNPGVAVSTPAVFGGRTGRFSEPATLPAGWTDCAALAVDLAALRNDLEPAARLLAPAIDAALAALRAASGCRLARMSGSGATCFALFDDAATAMATASALARPGWWCWGGPALLAGPQGDHY